MSGTAAGRKRARVEVCVDSLASALAARDGGADRVELCDNLLEGGTTPSAAMVEICAERLDIPVFVIIRPRGGDFLYSPDELEVMRRDIVHARRLGAAGVVLGILTAAGTVDVPRTRALIDVARPLSVTFHRAFDAARDADAALDALLETGADRVLTSGGAATAEEGIGTIGKLVARAGGRLAVMAGGGVREDNVERIVRETGVSEVHFRAAVQSPSAMHHRNPAIDFRARTSLSDEVLEVTDAGRVAAIVRRLAGMDTRPSGGMGHT